MNKKALFVLFFCTGLELALVYSIQPIAPLLMNEFSVSLKEVASLMSAVFAPLALCAFAFGILYEKWGVRYFLAFMFGVAGMCEICLAFVSEFDAFMGLRIIQGILVAGISVGLLSLAAKQKILHFYIAFNILGGILGRILAGAVSEYFSWRIWVVGLGILIILSSFLLLVHVRNEKFNFTFKSFFLVLKGNLVLYVSVFGLFFCFSALLTMLPFMLEIFSALNAGVLYSGYFVGVILSAFSTQIFAKWGKFSALFGGALFLFSLVLFGCLGQSFFVLLLACLCACGGFFIINAISCIKASNASYKSVSMGLYDSFYYSGGALGSFVMSLFFGDKVLFLGILACVMCVVVSLNFLALRKS